MSDAVAFDVKDEIGILTIDNPPVNALAQAVRQGLMAGIERAEAEPGVKVVLITAKGATFPAGADIKEFGKPPREPSLPDVCNRIEACSKPVVAVVHGTAYGGGFEIALASHYRIALPKARVGLPEVHLGILPGAGGTQRVPRLAGAATALELMLNGRPMGAQAAFDKNLMDRVATGDDPLTEGLAYAREVKDQRLAPRPTGERSEGLEDVAANQTALAEALKFTEARGKGLFAPYRIIEAVEAALTLPLAEGLARERELFMACMQSPQREGLVHAFFAERRSAKVPETAQAKPRKLESVAVIGGGTMGAGIAVALLDAGFPVTMIERDEENLARGRANVEKVYDRLISRHRMSEGDKAGVMARYKGTTDYSALKETDLVIEAVFEEMSVKKDVFAKLDAAMKPGAVLASNTSYLDIDALAATTSRPGDIIGLHFFSPANIMKLLEVVVPDKATAEAVATGFALAKRLQKVPVRAKVCDGFIGNRILAVYRQAVDFMLFDGASPYDIDAAMRDFGFAMGPFQVSDLAGGDIGWATRKRKAETRDKRLRYNPMSDRLCENGWFGQKTGRGWYLYPDGSRVGAPDPEVEAIIAEEREKAGIKPRDFSADEIVRRFMAAMINESANVVHDGTAARPSDVDVVFFHGYGFPRYRGGPLKYADMTGPDTVLADIEAFAKEGDKHFWVPSKLLQKIVKEGGSFDDLNRI